MGKAVKEVRLPQMVAAAADKVEQWVVEVAVQVSQLLQDKDIMVEVVVVAEMAQVMQQVREVAARVV
jgi:hypothetical protein